MITDCKGIIRVPDVWTNENWRDGIDNTVIALKEREAQVPPEYYGPIEITDEKIAHSKYLRTVILIDRVKGFEWLWERARKDPIEDNYNPQVYLWQRKEPLKEYPNSDLEGGVLSTEGFWGFGWGFHDGDDVSAEGVIKTRFSQTLFARKDYSFYGLPSFLEYCKFQGQYDIQELIRLNPSSKDTVELLKSLEAKVIPA